MARIIIAPGKYVQGKGELKNIAEYTKPFGENPFVLISESGKKRFGDIIEKSFEGTNIKFEVFNGECSYNEINRVGEKLGDADVVIGVGGGKIHDTAKAAAFYAKIPVVIVPTVASTDAPCSAVSVIYTDDGVVEDYLWLPSNPNLVLVDTQTVANAPSRLLVAGLGDALATFFEARANVRAGKTKAPAGGSITKSAYALAELCYDILLSKGLEAKLAVDKKACTKSLEDVVEANTYLSGIGFESGGLGAAHAIHNGFTALDETHDYYHGEKVAFGTLCQQILENAPADEVQELIEFCISVGLPVTLKEIGIKDVTEEKIRKVAEVATVDGESTHNMPFDVTTDDVYNAILGADAIGAYFLNE